MIKKINKKDITKSSIVDLVNLSQSQIDNMVIPFLDLPSDQRLLIKTANESKEHAYSPYSNFYVGSAVLCQDGRIFAGANNESASYGLTTCGERAAIAEANNNGARMFESLAIVTRGENFDSKEPSLSCGACRQWLYDYAQVSNRDLTILSANTDFSKVVRTNISYLFPAAFGPQDIGIDLEKYRTKMFIEGFE